MDDEVAEIKQHPTVVAAAFAMAQVYALWLEVFFQVVLKRTKLKGRLRGCDDEEGGERGRLRDVDKRDIERLVVGKDIDSPLGE